MRYLGNLRPPVPVIAATLIGWVIVLGILVDRLLIFGHHVAHQIGGLLGP